MDNLLDSWGLTVATFSPLVGALVMFLIPKEKIQKVKTEKKNGVHPKKKCFEIAKKGQNRLNFSLV